MNYELLHDTALEQAVLSCLIWDTTTEFSVCTDGLTAECFSDKRYKRLFAALATLHAEGKSIHDPGLIVDAMNRQTGWDTQVSIPDFLNMVMGDPNRLEVSQNIPHYVGSIIDYHNRRRLVMMMQTAAEKAANLGEEVSATTAETMKMLTESITIDASAVLPFQDALSGLQQRIQQNIHGTGQASYATGIRSLDICGGLHPSDLVVIAALSSHGKTALALTIVMNIAAKVCFYSMEMTPTELVARMMARRTGISSNKLTYGKLSDEEQERVVKAQQEITSLTDRIFFYERSVMTFESISQNIRYMHARHGISVAVIDYLQILGLKTPKYTNRETVIAAAARGFKALARELGIVIILLSQMNRDTSGPQIPNVHRIRDSGEINEAADVTLVLYRPEQEKITTYPAGRWADVDTRGTALVTVAKDRNGGTGGPHDFILGFNPQLTYFYDIEHLPKKQQNNSTQHPW